MATKTQSKKSTKKSAAKTSSKTKTNVQSAVIDTPTTAEKVKTSPLQSLKIRKAYIILIVLILALGVFLYYARGIFVAAVVNGQPISRLAIIKETEKQSGKQALDNIVRNTLIEQEARKANVTVTEKEIDDEIKKVESQIAKQGQKLDDVLAIQGMTQVDLRKLIRLDKLVGKIVGRDIKITDKEVNEYIEKNKELLSQDLSEAELKKTASEHLKQEKLNSKVQTWLETLRNKAKILYFVQY